MAQSKNARLALDEMGIDEVCEMILNGQSYRQIAAVASVSAGSVVSWLNETAERSARAREARAQAAILWDERAVEVIEKAQTAEEITKARELAHHYRWRAKMVNPKEYGDRTTISGDPENPLVLSQVAETRAQLIAKLEALAKPEPLTIEGESEEK